MGIYTALECKRIWNMITITIEKKRYKGIYSWDDLTLRKYIELASIPLPEGYEAFILADGKFTVDKLQEYVDEVSKISDEQLKGFIGFYRQVILCLTNIPEKVLNKVSDDLIKERYEYFFKPFIISLLYHKPVIHFMGQLKDYEPGYVSKNRVRIGWKYYYLPETVSIDGQDIPLFKEPVVSYIEACDVFRGAKMGREDVNKLALFMAIYLRRKGEKYSDKLAVTRRDMMLNVPMSIAWAVFFYTVRRLNSYANCTRLFGNLQRTTEQSVSEVRTYKSMAVGV